MLENAEQKLAARSGQGGDLASACDAMWMGLLVLSDAEGRRNQEGRNGDTSSLPASSLPSIKYANGAAGVLLRRKRDELIGADLTTIIDDPRIAESITSVLGALGGRKEGTRKDGDSSLPSSLCLLRASTSTSHSFAILLLPCTLYFFIFGVFGRLGESLVSCIGEEEATRKEKRVC